MIQTRYGTTRTTILIGRFAIKIPATVQWNLFLKGLLGNLQEAKFSKVDHRLCPVIFAMPLGFLNVMPRCEMLSRDVFFALDYEAFTSESNGIFCLSDMVEKKLDSFGMLNGKIVAVDYG